jgi:macrolide-specific efflux system membrane fusion protein
MLGVFFGIGGVSLLGMMWQHVTSSSQESKNYATVEATRGVIRKVVLSTGTVQPENKLSIKSPIDGRAEQVLVAIGDKVKQGQVLAWMSSSERASLLDVARTKGQKELERWEDFYKPAALVAPLDGTIIDKNLVPGQVVTASDAVFTMSDHLVVAANLDETDLAKTHLGQQVEMLLDAYPNQPFSGHVERIAYTSTTVSNVTTFEVDILPDQVPNFMRNGMTADLTFIIMESDHALLIPRLGVTHQGELDSVLVAGNPPKARTVCLGLNDGKQVEILSGLKEGETVLVEIPKLPTPVASSFFPAPPKGGGPGDGPP